MRAPREDRHGGVLAVRLRDVLADKLAELAEHCGGYGKAIEAMATEQALPPDWFRKHPGDVRGPHDVRVTFRLSARAERALRAWAGRRSRSAIIRHLVLFTFTEGRRVALGAATVNAPMPAASQPVPTPARPPVLLSTAVRPPASRSAPSIAQPSRPLTPADAFSHLPLHRPGLLYVCQVPGCEFAAGSGAVVRCRNHVDWVAPAFSHLPRLPAEQQYVCQLSNCRFTIGDGVSTGPVRVPAWCREHDLQLRRTPS